MPVTTGANFQKARAALRFVQQPTPGGIFFVNSVTGTSGGGRSPDEPCATIAQAIALCTAGAGDTIYLMPGHTEAISAAAGIAISTAGIRIIGLGNGRGRPTITYATSNAASFDVTAANTVISNVVFDFTGVSALTAAINVTAADVAFEDCEFVISTGTNAPVLGILTAATATRFRVERCRFLGAATSTDTCTAAIKHEVGVDFVIRDCYFAGKFTQAILNATNVLRGLIDSNRIVISGANVAITLASGTTTFIVNNRINVAASNTPIVAAAGFVAGNVYSAAAGVTAGTAATI